nr:ATP-binding cassette sub-family A member 3-like [Leptinotarsa decemlineata]
MGRNVDKFFLLMWKNVLLQYRKPLQTIVEIMATVFFCLILVYIRNGSDTKLRQDIVFPAFLPVPVERNLNDTTVEQIFNDSLVEQDYNDTIASVFGVPDRKILGNFEILYSPQNNQFATVMEYFNFIFKEVKAFKNSHELETYYVTHSENTKYAGIDFGDENKNISNINDIKKLEVSIRFPAELRAIQYGQGDWKTNLIYPIYQTAGPRYNGIPTGGVPNYHKEGFLGIQYFITASIILVKNGFTYDTINTKVTELEKWIVDNQVPVINMKRFPHAEWYEDPLHEMLKSTIGIIIMLSFVYTCINTTKSITTEKENQLKESMKIMGLPNWLHWSAWFVKCFIFLLISAIIIVVLLKFRWFTNKESAVFTRSDPIVMTLFLIFYIFATITFCFLVSVFFSKANIAATMAGFTWFLSYAPYLFMQNKYDILDLSDKLLACLAHNSAMGFGFQIMIMYEGSEGVQWNNIFTPNTPDDTLTLGLTMQMLVVDSVLYMLLALYIEAVFPGEYGVPQPWNFPFVVSYWCGQEYCMDDKNDKYSSVEGEFFECEPKNFKAGIQIKSLCKVFGNKVAVRNISLNMYENQITVLLGHNGAGKTTTMSMLTVNKSGRINRNKKYEEKFSNSAPKFRNGKASTLSGGMKRKLCVGIALCGNSKVVMLDEPTAGMDPSARRALWNLLRSQKQGRTMLLTTHFMDEADLLGDRIAIMADGELQCCGSSFFLKKKYGAGYRLIMEKGNDCDVEKVSCLLAKYISDIEIRSNVGTELTYLLDDNQSIIFESLLKELEEESTKLGILGYGISLTTLEEVFMKVGADHGHEENNNGLSLGNGLTKESTIELTPNKVDYSFSLIYSRVGADHGHEENNNGLSLGNGLTKESTIELTPNKDNVSILPVHTGGSSLLVNQFRAMFMKKYISIIRSWILSCIHMILPSISLIITFGVARYNRKTGNLPPMTLNLNKFENSVTQVENNGYGYTDVLESYGYLFSEVNNLTENTLELTRTNPNLVRRSYIVGASFEFIDIPFVGTTGNITAWFNNDPFHSPGISLGLVLDSIYRKLCNGSSIEFTNHPLPYMVKTEIIELFFGQSVGYQLAINVVFSMTFVSAFYVIFIVKEIKCGSKHLQFISGVKVLVFWMTNILCDSLTYALTISLFLITMTFFQEGGYSSSVDFGRMLIILLSFAWSFLPMIYIASYLFKEPSSGYSKLVLFGIFTGNVLFIMVQIFSTSGLKFKNIAEWLHWILLVTPHYCLATAFSESFKVYSFNEVCKRLFESCALMHISEDECFDIIGSKEITDVCTDLNISYFQWDSPGIGKNLFFSCFTGFSSYIILFSIEYGVFSRLTSYFEKYVSIHQPVKIMEEDSDVIDEKERISNATEMDIRLTYQLAVRDLTKFYKKSLAVNGLCLGVKKYECFGLLGVNGAGKTSTFKMITGDVKISYGDGWVTGKSIKNQLAEAQKCIGYCPQFDALLDDMTVHETIVMFSLLRGIRLENVYNLPRFLAKEFDFQRHLNKKAKELSGGNKRKVSTAISLIGDPPVLYLDEPTTGMDPAAKRYFWNALCKIRDNGKCIVLTSHSMEECEALCTRLAIMVNGNFRCLGSTQHLKNKFAEGYTLTIKLRKLSDFSGSQRSVAEPIEKFIEEHFPKAQMREKHQELVTYYITDKSIPLSKMFGVLEKAKRSDLNIEDYSLGQSSLEQVFLTFTRNQKETS